MRAGCTARIAAPVAAGLPVPNITAFVAGSSLVPLPWKGRCKSELPQASVRRLRELTIHEAHLDSLQLSVARGVLHPFLDGVLVVRSTGEVFDDVQSVPGLFGGNLEDGRLQAWRE